MELGTYNNTPVGPNLPLPFEVVFEPEQLFLKQQEPRNVILTLTADDEASLDRYTITVSANDGDKGIGATPCIRVIE